jgi:hypothetical protein
VCRPTPRSSMEFNDRIAASGISEKRPMQDRRRKGGSGPYQVWPPIHTIAPSSREVMDGDALYPITLHTRLSNTFVVLDKSQGMESEHMKVIGRVQHRSFS